MHHVSQFALGLVVLTQSLLSQAQNGRFDGIEVVAEPVTESVYMLTGAGGNIGVSAGPDGLLIIDDQYAPMAERIATALAQLEGDAALEERALKYVINTHYHGDHTGGNAFFGDRDATIVAHDNVRVRLLAAGDKPTAALPVITHTDGMKVYFNGDVLELTALSGHTDGDSAVYFREANVLHTGDLLFNGRFPYIDLDGGGGVVAYLQSQAAMLEMINDDTRIIPGHGPLATKADLVAMHDMIRASRASVASAVSEGLTLEAIIERGVDPAFKQFAWAFIDEGRWLTLLHRDVTANP